MLPLHASSLYFAPFHSDMILLRSVNISNAAILGLKEDLNITEGTKYNSALTIFFVPYILFEVPSNMLLKKLKPHVWCKCWDADSMLESSAH